MLSGKRKCEQIDSSSSCSVGDEALEKKSRRDPGALTNDCGSDMCWVASTRGSQCQSYVQQRSAPVTHFHRKYEGCGSGGNMHVALDAKMGNCNRPNSSYRNEVKDSRGCEGGGGSSSNNSGSSSSSSSKSYSASLNSTSSYISQAMSRAASSLYSSSYVCESDTALSGGPVKKAPYQRGRSSHEGSSSSYDDRYDDYDRHQIKSRDNKCIRPFLNDSFGILSDAYLRFDDIFASNDGDDRMLRKHLMYAAAMLALVLKAMGYCDFLDSYYLASSMVLTIFVCGGFSLLYLMKIVCV